MKTKTEVLAEAGTLLASTPFTREMKSRVDGLLALAETMGESTQAVYAQRARNAAGVPSRETRAETPKSFLSFLRYGDRRLSGEDRGELDARNRELRDMDSTGAGISPTGGGNFVPLQFENNALAMLRATDNLFDPDVVTVIRPTTGAPLGFPNFDDTTNAATVVAQGQQNIEQDLGTMGQLSFGVCQTWRSGLAKASVELAQDSAFDLGSLLAAAFGVRWARGIGRYNVGQLLAGATLGATANGSSANDGSGNTGADSVGSSDLLALMGSLDPAYAASPKCAWVMSWSTMIFIESLLDKNGRPLRLIHDDPVTGEPMLYHRPIRICPSMPSIGASGSPLAGNKPIAFGDLSRFIVRIPLGMVVSTLVERFAEYGQIAWNGLLRADSGVQVTAGADSPVKYLQNAA
jgi:HK97 family phage major capsid protein